MAFAQWVCSNPLWADEPWARSRGYPFQGRYEQQGVDYARPANKRTLVSSGRLTLPGGVPNCSGEAAIADRSDASERKCVEAACALRLRQR